MRLFVASAFRRRALVEKTGQRAAIGSLEEIEKIVEGTAHTNVVPDVHPTGWPVNRTHGGEITIG